MGLLDDIHGPALAARAFAVPDRNQHIARRDQSACHGIVPVLGPADVRALPGFLHRFGGSKQRTELAYGERLGKICSKRVR